MDLDRVRADTPGCNHVLHLDSAGSSLMPQSVLAAQLDHLQLEAEVGGYRAAALAEARIEATYGAVARLLNCGAEHIALMENATAAWNAAFQSLDLSSGDRVLVAEAEYASNVLACLVLKERRGIEVVPVPSDDAGQLDVAALENLIDARVKLIAMTHVPTNGGLVNPAQEVGAVARAAGIPYLLDACQSVGQIDLDVAVLGCDFLSASGRKFLRGPRGSGFLYVSPRIIDRVMPPALDLRGATWVSAEGYQPCADARRFENWEFNYAAVIGLGVAVDTALSLGMPAIEARVAAMAQGLRDRIAALPGAQVYDLGRRKCGIVTFSLAGREAEDLAQALAAQNIIVSCSSPSSTRLDADKRRLPTMLRASPHYFNTEAELDRFVAALTAPG